MLIEACAMPPAALVAIEVYTASRTPLSLHDRTVYVVIFEPDGSLVVIHGYHPGNLVSVRGAVGVDDGKLLPP